MPFIHVVVKPTTQDAAVGSQGGGAGGQEEGRAAGLPQGTAGPDGKQSSCRGHSLTIGVVFL